MRRTIIAGAVLVCTPFGFGACGGQVVIGGVLPPDGGSTEAGRQQLGGGSTTDVVNVVLTGGNGEAGVAIGAPPFAQITADTYTVTPGQEVFLCQTFSNPFGHLVDLVWFEAVAAMAHDVSLFSLPPKGGVSPAPTALIDCLPDPLGSRPFLMFFDQPGTGTVVQQTYGYPQTNMGYPLSAANSLLLRVHYINATNTSVSDRAQVLISGATPGQVTTQVGTIFLSHAGFPVNSLADGGPWIDETSSIPISQSYSLFLSWSFAQPFTLNTQVSASANGTVFYDVMNSGTSPQLSVQDPNLQVGTSEPITWRCTYPTGHLAMNGTCVYQGFYYPADPQNPDRSVYY